MGFWLPFSCPEALVWAKFISATFYHCVSRWSGRRTASSTHRPRSKTDGDLLRERLQRTKVGIYIVKGRLHKSCILVWGGQGAGRSICNHCGVWIGELDTAAFSGWLGREHTFPLEALNSRWFPHMGTHESFSSNLLPNLNGGGLVSLWFFSTHEYSLSVVCTHPASQSWSFCTDQGWGFLTVLFSDPICLSVKPGAQHRQYK